MRSVRGRQRASCGFGALRSVLECGWGEALVRAHGHSAGAWGWRGGWAFVCGPLWVDGGSRSGVDAGGRQRAAEGLRGDVRRRRVVSSVRRVVG